MTASEQTIGESFEGQVNSRRRHQLETQPERARGARAAAKVEEAIADGVVGMQMVEGNSVVVTSKYIKEKCIPQQKYIITEYIIALKITILVYQRVFTVFDC